MHSEASFRFVVDAAVERVGPMFGAHAERAWAHGWAPRFVHPAEERDVEGMVFTIDHPLGEAVWVNSRFELAAGVAQYVYVIARVVATVITVRFAGDGPRTSVDVTYARTALSPETRDAVRELSRGDAGAGPEWAREIAAALPTSSRGR